MRCLEDVRGVIVAHSVDHHCSQQIHTYRIYIYTHRHMHIARDMLIICTNTCMCIYKYKYIYIYVHVLFISMHILRDLHGCQHVPLW